MCPYILMIEDTPEDIEVFAGRLRRQRPGYEVGVESCGEAGLLALQRRLPDLIILDLGLPDMTGFEVLQRVRSNPRTRNVPVLIFTIDEQQELKGRRLRADDYLPKSADREVFLDRVQGLVSQGQTRTPAGSSAFSITIDDRLRFELTGSLRDSGDGVLSQLDRNRINP